MGFSPEHTPNAGKALKRTLRNCTGDVCQCLAEKIAEYTNAEKTGGSGTRGLVSRFVQQVATGASGPGTDSWVNHGNEITTQQNTLQQHLDEFDGRGCGTPIPSNARELAERPLPTAADWEVNNPVAYEGLTGSVAGDVAVGVGGAAATVGAGYLIYRGVRMIPSLFPPLWWTIPANAVAP